VRLFNLILAGVSVTRLGLTRPGDAGARAGEVLAGAGATFSIFFWLQVANFDVFLFLVLHVCYLSFAGFMWHRTAIDARPFRPVLESGHPDESIYLSCAWAFDFLTLRRAHSFAFRCTHFGFLCYQYPPSLKKSHQTISCRCVCS